MYPKMSVQQIFIKHLLWYARYTNPLYFELIHLFRYTDLGAVVVWMFVSSTKNSCVENLMPKVMVWRGGAIVRYLAHEDGALKYGINALIKETPESALAHVKTQQEDGCLWTRKPLPHPKPTGSTFLDFPGSGTGRNKFLLFISHPVYSSLKGLRPVPSF